MKLLHSIRRLLSAPLVYLAAIVLLGEDWLWRVGARLTALLARLPPLAALERWVAARGPRVAMLLFLLPALALLPVKLLALLAIARGHAAWGVAVIVLAKLVGAAAVARLYTLTLPALRRLAWFAALLDWFLPLKAAYISRLRASPVWRRVAGAAAALRRPGAALLKRLLRRPLKRLRLCLAARRRARHSS
ncbi:hypothetical protein ACFOLJ_16575 [Rugamonas sp. CCM 8940]|uniref:hypothetical protein n=1 Tax=Rugamonas sp. CCM 8940 TaxID=2765359 RepID=UPI0018F6B72D|nr:hypothetical protein [Rugamonas sp. CCM 8940]MBJ7312373.1 hypothetical protein [Rugamonas sp. CCM 8940]